MYIIIQFHLPSCTVVVAANRLCKYSCYQLRSNQNSLCMAFSDEYFFQECDNDEWYI